MAKDLSLKVCHLFKKGMCRFGNKCLYGHVQKEAAICRSFLAGRCTYGALCKFLHTVSSTSARSTIDGPGKPVIKSEKICFAFKNGSCGFGQNCAFAHVDSSELRLLKKDKRKRCFPFQKGECQRGDLCKFQHILGSASNFVGPCFEWQREGSCSKGDACRFEHIARTQTEGEETPSTERSRLYCYRFKKRGFCAKGESCEFAHIAAPALEDRTKKADEAVQGIALITNTADVSGLRAKWKALKRTNADETAVKEAKRRYKAAKDSALQSASLATKRSASSLDGRENESNRKQRKLSKRERARKAHIIRSRGMLALGR